MRRAIVVLAITYALEAPILAAVLLLLMPRLPHDSLIGPAVMFVSGLAIGLCVAVATERQ